MFDSKYITNHYGPDSVEVHEHRAPTDRSVELLAEMERAALNKVLATYRNDDNALRIAMVCVQIQPMDDRIKLYGMFTLNGEEFRVEHVCPRARIEVDQQDMVRKLHQALANEIAAMILEKAARHG